MKKTLTSRAWRFAIAALVFSAHHLSAQVNYNFSRNIDIFTPLTGGTEIEFSDMDDALSKGIVLPFGFEYFGEVHHAFKVSTNGFITFDTLSTDFRASNNLARCDQPLIAPLWGDLGGGTTGVASYRVYNSQPNRLVIIEYLNWHWPYSASTPNMSFQIRLYETTNAIDFVYQREAVKTAYTTSSIGIMSSAVDRFYSISTNYGELDCSQAYNNKQPADGEIYRFTPGAAPEEPTVQASDLTVTNITANSAELNWTRGNGKFEMVALRALPQNDDPAPVVDGKVYDGTAIGNGWVEKASIGDFIADPYNHTRILTLRRGYTYQAQIIGFNGVGGFQNYNPSSSAENFIEFTTENFRPAYNADHGVYHRGTTSVRFGLEGGDGEHKLILMKAENTDVVPPVMDSVFYEAGLFGEGSQFGNSGWYCVFRGVTNMVEIDSLPADTEFTVAFVDLNGAPGRELYLIDSTLLHFKTFHAKTVNYDFAKSTADFTELTGATAIDVIEDDDKMSGNLPIGFSFLYSGEPFDSVRVNSNGFVTFNVAGPASSSHHDMTWNRLGDNFFSPLLAPLWDDLSGAGGQASYKTEGSPGNRVFTVEFKNWKWNYAATGAAISMQVKLYENNNRVEYRYRQETGEVSNGSASIGLTFLDLDKKMSLTSSGADAEIDYQYNVLQLSQKPATNQVFSFTPGPAKFDQTITFDAVADCTYDPTTPILLHATASSGLPVTFTSDHENVMISGDTLWMLAAGNVYVTAHQEGNDLYHPAPTVDINFYIDQATDTLYFDPLPDTKYADNDTIELNATTYSGTPVMYQTSDSDIVYLNDNIIRPLAPGTAEITAYTYGANNFKQVSKTQTLVIVHGDQTIEFAELGERSYTIERIELNPYTDTGLPVHYESSNSDVVAVVGIYLEMRSIGTATVTASAEGNFRYNAAEPVVRDIMIIKGNQTINFPEFEGKQGLGTVVELDSLSKELLPVTYTADNNDVVQIDGNVVTIVGRGNAVITATQPGDDLYLAADPVSREVIVKTGQTITFEISDKTITDAPFALTGEASSGLPLDYFITGGNIAFTDNLVVMGAPGRAQIKAVQAGDNEFDNVSVTAEFCVKPLAPFIMFMGQTENGIELLASDNADINWLLDGEQLNAIGQNIITETSGSYTITSTVDLCTSAESEPYTLLVTDTETPLQRTVTLSPNPVKDVFYIDARDNGKSDVSIEMYDVVGRKLETWTGRGRIACDIARYESGNYVVHVRTNAGVVTGKVIKE